jgi:cytochrome c peroxidase
MKERRMRSGIRQLGLLLLGIASGAQAFEPLPKKPIEPATNPTTQAKVALGKMLYFDPRLSVDGSVSCNSCHNVMAGGEDGRSFSMGVRGQLGGRSSPTVWNAAFLSVQFWDGRAPSLEEQAKGPMINPVEMGNPDHAAVVKRLQGIDGYKPLFKQAFNTPEITIDRVAQAIAAYERTLTTPDSPLDRYLKGDKKALNESQVRGMQAFQEVGCVTCHSGAAFAGPALPEGQGFYQKFPAFPGSAYESKYRLTEDLGRFEVTHQEADRHMFRVPTLRNVALTAPYFHNGAVSTLEEAVRVMAKVQLNKELDDGQVRDLTAFLGALTGTFPRQEMPRLPPTPGRTAFAP